MTLDGLREVIDSFSVVLGTGSATTGGMSGSSVLVGHDAAGRGVVVKATSHNCDDHRTAAARELAVYVELAPRWALPVPSLIGAHVDERLTVLVLERRSPAPAPELWRAESWHALVVAVAGLHGRRPLPAGARWRRAEGGGLAPRGLALEGEDRPSVDTLWSTPGDQLLLGIVAEHLAALERAASGPDRAFGHGDCHVGNVLHDGRGLLLTDWQQSGIGASCADLAFALTRAVPSGAAPPREELLARYATLRGLDPDEVTRAVTASQILVLVRQYPLFVDGLAPVAVTRLRQALHALVEDWLTVEGPGRGRSLRSARRSPPSRRRGTPP